MFGGQATASQLMGMEGHPGAWRTSGVPDPTLLCNMSVLYELDLVWPMGMIIIVSSLLAAACREGLSLGLKMEGSNQQHIKKFYWLANMLGAMKVWSTLHYRRQCL